MFNKPDPRIPPEVARDRNAQEVLRAWIANGGLVCSLRPDAWDDSAGWGIALADVARHVANALYETRGVPREETLQRITALFNAELESPTDEPKGRFA